MAAASDYDSDCCIICASETSPGEAVVACSGAHKLCRDCGGQWVQSLSSDAEQLRPRATPNRIGCPAPSPSSPPPRPPLVALVGGGTGAGGPDLQRLRGRRHGGCRRAAERTAVVWKTRAAPCRRPEPRMPVAALPHRAGPRRRGVHRGPARPAAAPLLRPSPSVAQACHAHVPLFCRRFAPAETVQRSQNGLRAQSCRAPVKRAPTVAAAIVEDLRGLHGPRNSAVARGLDAAITEASKTRPTQRRRQQEQQQQQPGEEEEEEEEEEEQQRTTTTSTTVSAAASTG